MYPFFEKGYAHALDKLKGPVLGEHLLWLFKRLGMKVRLEMHIHVLEHGKLKTIEDKLKGE